MNAPLLRFLRCPDCVGELELTTLTTAQTVAGSEIMEGLLSCPEGHWFPVVRGIPRMLPDALAKHWGALRPHLSQLSAEARAAVEARSGGASREYDRRTQANFSHEWDNHDLGGKTWGMDLEDRVRWFFLEPLRVTPEEVRGKVMLDAGCGNGSQSVAYTKLGLEVIALDLSSGLEHGYAFRQLYPGADPAKVHFVQGDLQRPPLAPASLDLIHSAGVLHHTPDTYRTFLALRPLLRAGGQFYVWLYKYEPLITPTVNAIRAVTTRLPASIFAQAANLLALPFRGFCATVNALGLRSYPPVSQREAALALMDIFGAPYAHYHSLPEVSEWFAREGFVEIWDCNDGRRGFGVCGRLAPAAAEEPAAETAPERFEMAG